MKVTIWSDFACPFCYMEEYMLEKTAREAELAGKPQVEIEMRAYELSPEAPVIPSESMEEHFSSAHDISIDDARSQMVRITKMAARAGLDYNLEGVQVCNTFDAHRLMKLAYDTTDSATALKLNFALFHANFIENKRLSDHAVLKEIAVAAGLDPKAVEDTLTSDRYADKVRADEEEADRFDLEYVPYMQFSDGRILQGVLSAGAIRKALNGE